MTGPETNGPGTADGGPEVPASTAGRLAAVVASAFMVGRDHAGRPYARSVSTGTVYPLGGKRRPPGLVGAVEVAYLAAHPEHATRPPSDPAVRRAVETLTARALAADPDPAPAVDGDNQDGDGDQGEGAAPGWADGLTALPAGWRCPDGYRVTRSGVFRLPTFAGGEVEAVPVRVTFAPVVPVAVFTDPDGRQMVDLAFVTRFGWVVKSVDRSIAKSGRRLVAALGDAGLPVIESDAKQVERWLAEAELANTDVIPAEALARWIGWQPDGLWLMPGADAGRRIEWRWTEQAEVAERIHAAGTLAGWQDAVRRLHRDLYVQVVLAAGFAAPLLRPLNLPVAFLDIYGASTRGKTTAALIAYSVWGQPVGEGEHGIGTWSNSLVQLEKYTSLGHGVLAVLDDSQKAPERGKDVTAFLYWASGGRGKGRGSVQGSREHPNSVLIRTFIVSTGEKPLTAFSKAAGLAPRRLPFGRTPFPRTDNPAAEAKRIDAIMAGLLVNYGHAGPAFVARLQAGLDRPDGLTALQERHQALTEQLRGATPVTARRAPLAAVLRLGAELAHAWQILPLEPPPLELWQDLFVSADATDGEDIGAAALAVVEAELAAHPDRLYTPTAYAHALATSGDRPPTAGYLARYLDVDGARHLIANRELVRDLLTRHDFDFDAVLTLWKDAKTIRQVPDGKSATWRWVKRTTLGPGSTRTDCLVFSRDAVNPDEPTDPEDDPA
jgi:hypothetical protein